MAAWAMHRRADYATAAAIRSDERVEGFVTEAREPLTVLRTLGGMLSTHLKPESPSRDMAEAIVAQGDVLAELSSELESALYPRHIVDELAGAARAQAPRTRRSAEAPAGARAARARRRASAAARDGHRGGARERRVAFVRRHAAGRRPARLGGGYGQARGRGHDCDIPGGRRRARARARRPRDARETLARVIDAALVAAPRGGSVDVVVSANGGLKGGVVVAVGVSAGDASETVSARDALPAGALSAAAAETAAGFGDAFASETARAATSARARRPQNRAGARGAHGGDAEPTDRAVARGGRGGNLPCVAVGAAGGGPRRDVVARRGGRTERDT